MKKKTVVQKLYDALEVGRDHTDAFTYIGLEIERTTGSVYLFQNKYTDSIKFVNSEEISEEIFRARVGQLMWLATQTRPDLSFAANFLASTIPPVLTEA